MIEEAWVFLIEMIYQQELKSDVLIFENEHKKLFQKEILQYQYINDVFDNIKRQYNNYQHRKKNNLKKNQGDNLL